MLKRIIQAAGDLMPHKATDAEYTLENYKNYGINALEKGVLDRRIARLIANPPRNRKRTQPLTVNLTSFPQRINETHYAVFSLLTQSLAPDHVILWLSEEEFPRGVEDLPETLTSLTRLGLQLGWCRNLKPYKKLLPALQTRPGEIHVTADDDIVYPRDWLKELYEEYMQHGDRFIYAHRAHKIALNASGVEIYKEWEKEIAYRVPSFLHFATGCAGALYPPGSLHERVTDIADILALSPQADDLWFWAMAVMNDTRTRITKTRRKLVYINPDRELRLSGELTLSQENVVNEGNDRQLKNILERFPMITEKLLIEARRD
jgi:hypothetical protein